MLAWSSCDAPKKLTRLELLLRKMLIWALFDLPSYFFFISSIIFCLKSLPPQESDWPPCGPGTLPRLGWCTVKEHDTVLHRDLERQSVDGCVVDKISDPCFAHTTPGAPEEVPHIPPPGVVILVASPDSDCVGGAGPNLSTAGHPHSNFYF